MSGYPDFPILSKEACPKCSRKPCQGLLKGNGRSITVPEGVAPQNCPLIVRSGNRVLPAEGTNRDLSRSIFARSGSSSTARLFGFSSLVPTQHDRLWNGAARGGNPVVLYAKVGSKAFSDLKEWERKKRKVWAKNPKEEEWIEPEAQDVLAPEYWIEIELVDEEDEPVPGAKYSLEWPDGAIRQGHLNTHGYARVASSGKGPCQVGFPEYDQEAWERHDGLLRKGWIEIEMVDEEGKPAGWEEYRVEGDKGIVKSGFLNAAGRARVPKLADDMCRISFPRLDAEVWEKAEL